MEFEVLVLTALIATVRGIVVDQSPLAYGLTGGYASQYPFGFAQSANPIYKYGNPNVIPYTKSPQQSRYNSGSQYAAGYPTIHHPAEYTYASPPVRHANPINYPVPPAPVKENVQDVQQQQQIPLFGADFGTTDLGLTYTIPQSNLLGVSYSPASDVSSMSFSNGYGISYGY